MSVRILCEKPLPPYLAPCTKVLGGGGAQSRHIHRGVGSVRRNNAACCRLGESHVSSVSRGLGAQAQHMVPVLKCRLAESTSPGGKTCRLETVPG